MLALAVMEMGGELSASASASIGFIFGFSASFFILRCRQLQLPCCRCHCVELHARVPCVKHLVVKMKEQ